MAWPRCYPPTESLAGWPDVWERALATVEASLPERRTQRLQVRPGARTAASPGVMAASDDPPEVTIEPHLEMSYDQAMPANILFYCHQVVTGRQ